MADNNWKTAALEEVAQVVMGQSPPSEFVSDVEGNGLPFLQGNAEFSTVYPLPRFWCSKPSKTCKAGDVLISVRAPVGAISRTEQDYCIGRGLAAVRFSRYIPEFGYYALCHFGSELRRVAQGSTFEAIGGTELRQLSIPKCSDLQQRRIAKILDTVDEAIRRTELVIEKLQQMKQGLLHDLLTRGIDENGELRPPPEEAPHLYKDSPLGLIPKGWTFPNIGELAAHVGSGITPFGGNETYLSEGVTFIRSQNVHFEGLNLDDVAFIGMNVHREMARSAIFQNDVLLNITGASIGRCCHVPAGLGLANVNQHVCAIRLFNAASIDAEFLAAFLGSPFGQHQVDILNAGSNRQGLNYQQVRAFVVLWPDAEERAQITSRIAAHNDQITTEKADMHKLHLVKKGLMDDLLTGRVRVKTSIEEP